MPGTRQQPSGQAVGTIPQRLARVACGLGLILLAGFFVWYGLCSKNHSSRNLEGLRTIPASQCFSETWNLMGHQALFGSLQTDTATRYYQKAISQQPLQVRAWIGLARSRLLDGDDRGALEVFKNLTGSLTQVSTWKWQELLLAFDLEQEMDFRRILNFLLARSPHRATDACLLASRFWSGWQAILAQIDPGNRSIFIKECIKASKPDTALLAWQTIQAPDRELGLRLCHFLLEQDQLKKAQAVWQDIHGKPSPVLHNGGFEDPFLNQAFGWRVKQSKQASVTRSQIGSLEQGSCLHIRFQGTANLNFHHLFQIVPVTPGKSYLLEFAQKSRGLSTDQGLFLQITGYRCPALDIRSPALTGTADWHWMEIKLQVPQNCSALVLQLRRQESLRLDNKISGEYWLDGLSMTVDRYSQQAGRIKGRLSSNAGH